MFSPLRMLRCYSTQRALKLWVKHNGNPSTQVPIKGCINIDDFATKVKKKLNANCQVALFSSLDKEAIRPGLSLKELLKMEEFKNNSDESPLFVKLIPFTQDPIPPKTIYIEEMDYNGNYTGEEYKKVIVRNEDVVLNVIWSGDGLMHPSSPDYLLTSFEDIKDGEKYQFHREMFQTILNGV